MYPGTFDDLNRFAIVIDEIEPGETCEVAGIDVEAFEVSHPSGAPPLAYRFGADGRRIGFSGDTEWVEALALASRDTDLFICECTGYTNPVPYHVDFTTLLARRDELGGKRIILSHLGPEMIEVADTLELPDCELAEDGLVVEL